MYTYPQLSASEQASLPKLIEPADAIPNKFADSTHQLFACRTVDGDMVLKVCNAASIAHSTFWQGANHLFGTDFPNSLGHIHLTHDFLQQHGKLNVPDYIAAHAGRFVLCRFIDGTDFQAEQITDAWVIALADHVAALHQCKHPQWGMLHAPQLPAAAWTDRVRDTLIVLAQQHTSLALEPWLSAALSQIDQLHESEFVPMMLDLRWDQFRHTSEGGLALIDLDAFVMAPRAIDLLLLENVLSPAQWQVFKPHYMQSHAWPDLTAQKPCYQLLLFLLNVLGETDLARWMQRLKRPGLER